MTVRNEFLGGFQHNMRNDYVKGALKGKERLQGVVREHAPQRPLLPRPGPAAGGGRAMLKVLRFRPDGAGREACWSPSVQDTGTGRITYSGARDTQENEKRGVSL